MLNVTVDLFFWSYTFIQVENMKIMDKITEMHFLLTLGRAKKALLSQKRTLTAEEITDQNRRKYTQILSIKAGVIL